MIAVKGGLAYIHATQRIYVTLVGLTSLIITSVQLLRQTLLILLQPDPTILRRTHLRLGPSVGLLIIRQTPSTIQIAGDSNNIYADLWVDRNNGEPSRGIQMAAERPGTCRSPYLGRYEAPDVAGTTTRNMTGAHGFSTASSPA